MPTQYLIYGAIGLTVFLVAVFTGREWAKNKFNFSKSSSVKSGLVKPDNVEQTEWDKFTDIQKIEAIKKSLPDPIEARVFDRAKRKVYDAILPGEAVKATLTKYSVLGRQINRNGKMIYYMVKVGENDYKPYDFYYGLDRQYSPAYLYDKINLPEMKLTHNIELPQSLMDKYGHLIPWSLGIAFIIFMMVSQKKV